MEEKKSNRGNLMLAVLCIAIFAPNYTQYQLSPLSGQLIEQLSISASQYTSIFTSPMIPALFLSLVAGVLVDRFGPRYIIGASLVISSVGTIVHMVATSFTPMLIGTALTGVSACFLTSCGAKILAGFFSSEEVGSKMGIFLASSTIAMTIAMATSAIFPSLQSAFIVSVVISCLGTILWFLFYRDNETGDEASSSDSVTENLKVVLKNKYAWIIGFALFFVMCGNVVIGSFLPTALSTNDIDPVTAGLYASVYTIGNLLGCFVAPWLATRIGGTKRVMIIFAVLAAIGVAFAWQVPQGILLGSALLATGTCLGGIIPLFMSTPIRLEGIGPKYAGTAGGFTSTIQIMGAVLVPSYVLVPIAGDNFSLLFILGGVCMLLCATISLLIPSDSKIKINAQEEINYE